MSQIESVDILTFRDQTEFHRVTHNILISFQKNIFLNYRVWNLWMYKNKFEASLVVQNSENRTDQETDFWFLISENRN